MAPTELACGDCVEVMAKLPAASFNLVFADPPFGINYEYDVYEDTSEYDAYMDFARRWGTQVKRVLKPDGTFWLAIGDAFVSDLDVYFRRELGFHRRSWVVWHYTFGVNCKGKFTPAHTHLLYYVLDPKRFTFNPVAVKVPSARQMVYGDKRAKAGGRLPDDVWVLRPGEAQKNGDAYRADDDVWLASRVCGTFKERTEHPCQLPEAILERILLATTNEGDRVLDPMAGSGTTLAVARRLARPSLGVELSPNYCDIIRRRLGLLPEAASA